MKNTLAFALFGLMTMGAHALPSDIKVLAQFDLGFAQCESRYEHMRGHADEAYLALWKVKPDEKRRAELATARKGKAYKQARADASKTLGKGHGPEFEEKIKRQCQATWNEAQRNTPPR